MDRDVVRELKRIEREIGFLHEEDRLLRERISVASGDFSSEFFKQTALNGSLTTGDGISGGGTFPGVVSISVDLATTSGLEFSSGELQVADSVAGDGLSIASKIMAIDLVDAWSGLEISSAELRVHQGAAFSWTALHTFQNDPAVTFDPQSDQDQTLFSVNVTGTPASIWDESEDAFSWNKGQIIEGGLSVGTDTLSILAKAQVYQTDSSGNISSLILRNADSGEFNIAVITPDALAGDINVLKIESSSGDPSLVWDESEFSFRWSDDIILEQRIFGFAKFQNADGRIGNGPVEYGEVFGVGGVFELSAACAIYEEVEIT